MGLSARKDVPAEDTWALEDMFATDEDWEKEYASIKKAIPELAACRGQIAGQITAMQPVLDRFFGLERRYDHLMQYAKMRQDQDAGNSFYQNLNARAGSLGSELEAAASWIRPEILTHSAEEIEAELSRNPGLKDYDRWVRELVRRNAHTLDTASEELLAQASEIARVPENVYNMLITADLKFPDAVLEDGTRISVTNSSLTTLLENPDRSARRAVFNTYYDQLHAFGNTFAGMLDGFAKQTAFYARARKYASGRAMAMDADNIPESVYDNLIAAVNESLPSFHRYIALRKKIMGVDELHMYDIYARLFPEGGRTYTRREAEDTIAAALAPMGEEYVSLLRQGFADRWIDYYPNQGKSGGAYSWGSYDSHPYVLTNFQGTLDSVSTLAHEMGHSLHTWYSNHNQPYAKSAYSMFVAEVASTCNEALLISYLLKNTDDKDEKKAYLNYFLDTFKGTLFRQTQFAEFEYDFHTMCGEGTPLTQDTLNDLYLKINRKYYGPDMVSDPGIAYEWMRIPHFYMQYYVYVYATSYAAAVAISSRILREGKPAVDDYLHLLKGGCSKDPIELLREAGVDMTTKKPVLDAVGRFNELLDELEALTD